MSHVDFSNLVQERANIARERLHSCDLCPRGCHVNRLQGSLGYCRTGPEAVVSSVIPHLGEEPPLIGGRGAGTIFFSWCNLTCVYCQNHEISQSGLGEQMTTQELASKIVWLKELGCENIEPVTPTHQLPAFLDALCLAAKKTELPPVVYNTNGYDSIETLDLLQGIVSIYLPDLRYSSNDAASRFSNAPDYPSIARKAILKMWSQVGDLTINPETGAAKKGLLIRLLALPCDMSGTKESLSWIADNLPSTTHISLMSQYSPLYKSAEFPPINRKLFVQEYDDLVDHAWNLGLKNVLIQDMTSQDTGVPDFSKRDPFKWD